jgi:concanavalin A-like lectin/glucanase superfamily protein
LVTIDRGGALDLPEPDDRLSSWKEIAAFLGRTIRTVQRWEKTDGLPVRRGGPGQRGLIVASKREISAWWERHSAAANRSPSVRVRVVLAAGLLALAAIVATALPVLRRLTATTESPVRTGRLLVASTSEGRTLSSIPLNAAASALTLSRSGRLVFVSIPDERTVKVIDLAARKVVDSYDVLESPGKLILSPDERRLFIAGSSEVGVLDIRRRTVTRFDPGGIVRDMHVSRDGRHVWITLAQAGLKILDLARARWDTLPTVGCPMHMTSAPRSRRLFLAYQCGGPGGYSGHDAIEIMDEAARMPIIARAGPPLVGTPLSLSPDEQLLWVDALDACANLDYDHDGCPPGNGPVLHAFRGGTLEHLLTVRIAGSRQDSRPIFVPDGTRLVLGGFDLTVIDSARGTVLESIARESGFGEFTADGSRFVALDLAKQNRALLDLEVAPPFDPGTVQGMATHWSGDGTANDIVGGTHATNTSGARFEAGRYGRAFAFDEASVGLSFGRRIEADISDGPAAYAAWIKLRDTGAPRHIASRTSLHTWTWSVTADGHLSFCLVHAEPGLPCAVGHVTGEVTLKPDRWYHVAVVRGHSALILFVDGQLDGSRPLPGSFRPPHPLGDTAVLRLGAGPAGSAPFHGLIDEVMLFRRALAPEEIIRVMRATTLGS